MARLRRVRTIVDDELLADVVRSAPVDLRSAVHAADDELRAFARGVYPAVLTARGLAAALEELAAAGALPVTMTVEEARLPVDVEATAYLVCAEALANVSKHAQAARVTVSATTSGDMLALVVTDDGLGGADPTGSGIRGIRDRVAALGGTSGRGQPGRWRNHRPGRHPVRPAFAGRSA